jgi:hypothetical protein
MDSAEQNPDIQGIEDRKAKTHKGRRFLDKYKPKTNEDPRQCLILKGNKTSERVTRLMDYLVLFRHLERHPKRLEHKVPEEKRYQAV